MASVKRNPQPNHTRQPRNRQARSARAAASGHTKYSKRPIQHEQHKPDGLRPKGRLPWPHTTGVGTN